MLLSQCKRLFVMKRSYPRSAVSKTKKKTNQAFWRIASGLMLLKESLYSKGLQGVLKSPREGSSLISGEIESSYYGPKVATD